MQRAWIIPAYAGSTASKRSSIPSSRDHPRIRGEHVRASLMPPYQRGSSPHTRGAHGSGDPRVEAVGIIPAYAGSTLDPDRSGVGDWDHPRIRGEHVWPDVMWPKAFGSSPHTRGAPTGSASPAAPARIIPAYAGSTAVRASHRAPTTDHPRIRGEHGGNIMPVENVPGSSPHTRGALVRGLLL